ncbi:hypothetical protein Q5P01_008098 [Channa striata]|uniref:Death domain-containing protein n=1 Tax=Channa striata TaxID=64152 RepID=A0AA88NAM5_CHASR|nr:hypothetical protein Q5P01_008098 [Channa striata]
MKAWRFCLLLVLPHLGLALGEDTVAADIHVHQLERLVELLTPDECEDLLFTISSPDETIFQLERLSEEHNPLDLSRSEAQCRDSLAAWLLVYGEQTYYDRLSRALQHIGRTDVANEVGKNINQDIILNLKRYVEDYHKYATSLHVPPVHSDTKHDMNLHQQAKTRKVRDVPLPDLDLIVERAPVPLYQKGPLRVVLPLLYGILLGFGGTFARRRLYSPPRRPLLPQRQAEPSPQGQDQP